MMMPAIGSTSSTQAAEVAKSRNASELNLIGAAAHAIAEAAHRLNHVGRDLLPQAADENLDGVTIAVEVLLVEMLDELRARDDAARVMHQVGEQPILVGG